MQQVMADHGLRRGENELEIYVMCEIPANVICATSERSIIDCLQVMTDQRIRHLPVVDDGQLVGIVSIGDLVKRIINDQKTIIEELQQKGS